MKLKVFNPIRLWQLTENEFHFEVHIHFCEDLMMSRVEDVVGAC